MRFQLLMLILPVCGAFETPKKWTVFKFVQEWPSSICAQKYKCHKVPAVVSGWTVHGLWPTNKDAKNFTMFCNNSWPFDWNQIQSLQVDLQKHWPNLLHSKRRRPSHRFWQDEWVKHGTCATSVPATGNEYKYFKKALDLNTQLNITRALQAASIVPSCSRKYDVCDIQKAIRSHLKLNTFPQVVFNYERQSRRQLLEQVEICVKKDFTFDSCSHLDIKCKSGDEVYIYPEHVVKCP